MTKTKTTAPSSKSEEDLYEISAVARLTGLSTHNLRIWERRHHVVEPVRSPSKRRLYSRDDLRKLGLLKTLVDRGHSIGSLARLDVKQLEQRLRDAERGSGIMPTRSGAAKSPGRRCRVAVAGPFVNLQFRDDGPLSEQFRVVSEHADLEALREGLRPGSVDVIVIEEPTLFDDRIEAIQKLLSQVKATRAVVTYRFAPEKAIARIEANLPAISTLRAPANSTELRLACLAGMALPDSDLNEVSTTTPAKEDRSAELEGDDEGANEIPARRYSDAEIAGIARLSGSVKCECPQHLANLVSSLAAFELYSSECENRNAEDARLHAYLHRASAAARASMEEALTAVLRTEDLEIPV